MRSETASFGFARVRRASLLIAGLLLAAASPARSQCIPNSLVRTQNNPAPAAGDAFGRSVALDGNLAVIGSPKDDPSGLTDAGTARVFQISTGALQATLLDPARLGGDELGIAVGISGGVAVVGVWKDDPGGVSAAGSAIVFNANTGAVLTNLVNPSATVNDEFGASVAISGNTAVVGTRLDDAGATDSGTVYVYNASTGGLIRTINNPAPTMNDFFGTSVAIAGNLIVIGAPGEDPGGVNAAGIAYVFDNSTGALVATLGNPASAAGDQFGNAVSISGTTVVVGASFDAPGGVSFAGSAYVFDANTGVLLHTLNNPDPVVTDFFGGSVSISGTRIAVGAERDDAGAADTGTVYIFDAGTGALTATLNNPAPANNDHFGAAVAVSGAATVVGAGDDDPSGIVDAGTAYVYNCIFTPTPTPTPTASATVTPTPSATATVTPTDPPCTPTTHVRDLVLAAPSPSDGLSGVALDGTLAVVGRLQDDPGGISGSGSAQIRDVTDGSIIANLLSPNAQTNGFFGEDVDLDGQRLIVSARLEQVGGQSLAGRAYIFNSLTGALAHTLTDPAPAASDEFGSDVAISGNLAIVGALGKDPGGISRAGIARVYNASTGVLFRTLLNPTPDDGDLFGAAVDIDGNLAIVGAIDAVASGIDLVGEAYVFNVNTGALVSTLLNPVTVPLGDFGKAVAISGGLAVVGAPNADPPGFPADEIGVAHVYDALTGALLRTIPNPDAPSSDRFGFSLWLHEDRVLVGAPDAFRAGQFNVGTAWLFDVLTGGLLAEIPNPQPVGGDFFGGSVTLGDGFAVVGASGADLPGISNAGIAHVFDCSIPPTPTPSPTPCDPANLQWIVPNPQPAASDEFGREIAMSGNLGVVGEELDSPGGVSGSGSARLVDLVSGAVLLNLLNPFPRVDDNFGTAVAIDENIALVSSRAVGEFGTSTGGEVHVYAVPAGLFLRTVVSPSGSAVNGAFGRDGLAVSGNLGAACDHVSRTVFVFDVETGLTVSSFAVPPGDEIAGGLRKVAMSGARTVIGLPSATVSGMSGAGKVYVFDSLTGGLVSTIPNPLPGNLDQFGTAVAISDGLVIVGALNDDSGATPDAGTARIFDAETGALVATLVDPAPDTGDAFGASVAIRGGRALVGAFFAESGTGTIDAGRAFLFDAASGTLERTFDNPSGAVSGRFGRSVAYENNLAFIGAPGNNPGGVSEAGEAFIFNCAPLGPPATATPTVTASPTPTPCLPSNLQWIVENPAPVPNDFFGRSLAADGFIGIAGVNDSPAGAAVTFDLLTGSVLATLNHPSPSPLDNFGISVSVSGNLAIVGAIFDEVSSIEEAGSAHIYNATTGAHLRTLTSPGGLAAFERFGRAVSISGSLAFVGTATDVAYVIDANTGALVSTIVNPDPDPNEIFGNVVAISGNLVIAGVPEDDPGGSPSSGVAYVFNALTGALISTLPNPDPDSSDLFGDIVAISGGLAVVGTTQDDPGGIDSAGSAYVFDAMTGALLSTLASPSPEAGGRFGGALAISGSLVLVGALGEDSGGGVQLAGRAHLFDPLTGALLYTLDNPRPTIGDFFGTNVALAGDFTVTAAIFDESGGVTGAGTVYVHNCAPLGPSASATPSVTPTASPSPTPCGPSTLSRVVANPSPDNDDNFGRAVDMDGGRLAVGAPRNFQGAINSAGSVFVFDPVTGSLMTTVNNPAAEAFDQFGAAVALDGGLLVVGVPFDDDDSATDTGSVEVFDAATGAHLFHLERMFKSPGDGFGTSVAVSDGRVVGGEPFHTGSAVSEGEVHFFNLVTGFVTHTVANPSPGTGDRFGEAVALSGNILLVGAPNDSPGGVSAAGSAYLFQASSGLLTATLSNPSPNASDLFGASVALGHGLALVGCPDDDPGGLSSAGTAHLFDATTGAYIMELINPDPDTGDRFGASVSLGGGLVVVTATGDTLSAGVAYAYDLNGSLLATLPNPFPASLDRFGSASAASGGMVAIGVPEDDPAGKTNTGEVFVFGCPGDPTPTPTPAPTQTATATPTASPTPFGCVTQLVNAGFETIDYTGWTLTQSSGGGDPPAGTQGVEKGGTVIATNDLVFDFFDMVNVAQTSPGLPITVTATELESAGLTLQTTGDRFIMRQDVALDPGTTTLSWDMRYTNHHGSFASSTQAIHMQIRNATTDAVIQTLFVTTNGVDPLTVPTMTTYSADVSAFAGQLIRITMQINAVLNNLDVIYDNFTLSCVPVATPTPSPAPTASPTPFCCPGDANNSSGTVNASDFLAVQANFGADNGFGGYGDANCSGGAVNASDFLAVQANFGASCG